ncbi:uncharacterized protein LOC142350774 [Convolutriloba macropyga]|uniref:uncharacterized protein LOC142350774 n=1 Tax=Convolutriloba macropyga TaxID=536237 RepID=UPI003F525FE0
MITTVKKICNGRYTFDESKFLGGGGFGNVYEGRDLSTGTLVAIKIQTFENADLDSVLARLFLETAVPPMSVSVSVLPGSVSVSMNAFVPATRAKRVPPIDHIEQDLRNYERATRELDALKELFHPNIVKFLDGEKVPPLKCAERNLIGLRLKLRMELG